MQKLQNSINFWYKNTSVGSYSHKKFLSVKKHFFLYTSTESFVFVTQLLRVNMGVHLTPKLKKIFSASLEIAYTACHKTSK